MPKHLLDLYFFSRNADRKAISAADSPQASRASGHLYHRFSSQVQAAETGAWDYYVEAAYQFGNFQDRRLAGGPRLDHQAWMAVAGGGYTFKEAWGKLRLGLEYSYGSGTTTRLMAIMARLKIFSPRTINSMATWIFFPCKTFTTCVASSP